MKLSTFILILKVIVCLIALAVGWISAEFPGLLAAVTGLLIGMQIGMYPSQERPSEGVVLTFPSPEEDAVTKEYVEKSVRAKQGTNYPVSIDRPPVKPKASPDKLTANTIVIDILQARVDELVPIKSVLETIAHEQAFNLANGIEDRIWMYEQKIRKLKDHV